MARLLVWLTVVCAAPSGHTEVLPTGLISPPTFSGSVRTRVEHWSWFDSALADHDYTFAAALPKLALDHHGAALDWRVEGAFPVLLGLPRDATARGPQAQLGMGAAYFAASGSRDVGANLRQAYAQWRGAFGDAASRLRVGRFDFADGAETTPADPALALLKREHIAQRLLGGFLFTHVQRSFDGVQYSHDAGGLNLTLFSARPTEGVFQLNANDELDIDVHYAAATRAFADPAKPMEVRLFTLYYHDDRGVVKTDSRSAAVRATDRAAIRLTTVGGHWLARVAVGNGAFDALAWGAVQFGDWGRLDQQAHAFALEGGYQWKLAWQPWLRVGYYRGSGDDAAEDGTNGTFFQMLPTPRVYARFPFYNMMNSQDAFIQLRLKPLGALALRADLRRVWLTEEADLWYLGGGAFQADTFGYAGRPSSGRRGLGTLLDLSADCTLSKSSAVTLYAAVLAGGGVPGALHREASGTPLGHFLFAEFTWQF